MKMAKRLTLLVLALVLAFMPVVASALVQKDLENTVWTMAVNVNKVKYQGTLRFYTDGDAAGKLSVLGTTSQLQAAKYVLGADGKLSVTWTRPGGAEYSMSGMAVANKKINSIKLKNASINLPGVVTPGSLNTATMKKITPKISKIKTPTGTINQPYVLEIKTNAAAEWCVVYKADGTTKLVEGKVDNGSAKLTLPATEMTEKKTTVVVKVGLANAAGTAVIDATLSKGVKKVIKCK